MTELDKQCEEVLQTRINLSFSLKDSPKSLKTQLDFHRGFIHGMYNQTGLTIFAKASSANIELITRTFCS